MIEKIFDKKNIVVENNVGEWQERVDDSHNKIHQGDGLGGDFLGWVNLPINYDKEEFSRIKKTSEKIRSNSDTLVVIGIGGSYLGARAVIEALEGDKKVDIVFAGNNLSSRQMNRLLKEIEGKEVSLNIISKSGVTIEPAIAFRVLRKWMEDKYGDEAKSRIYVTTDKEKGLLKKLAKDKDYESFVIPDDIGGRYSVLTGVGLLAIGVAGIDIEEMMNGAEEAMDKYSDSNLEENDCYSYAVCRNILYEQGKVIEVLVNYDPGLHFMGGWWKQLFGESEGKDKKGIWPDSVDFTTDLHSLGQFIQDGSRNLFETVLWFEDDKEKEIIIEKGREDSGELDLLVGKSLKEVNEKAMKGTVLAHVEGGVPNLMIKIAKLDAYHLGYLIYFFEKACAMSAYLLGVNPFNQPGVEAYKGRMFELLGKGSEEEKELEDRLK